MSTYSVLIIFTLTRALDLFVSYIAPRFVSYLGFFPYKEMFGLSKLPPYIFSFANFDGVHYVRIALYGYTQYSQAFFPLYPLFIRHTSFLFNNNFILTGFIISQISFCIGLVMFSRYLKLIGFNKNRTVWTVLLLCFFPSSFFFGSVYNMSLFFCFVICALYYFEKKQYIFTVLFSMLASVTRIEGIFLIIPFAVPLITKKFPASRSQILLLLAPIGGLAVFMIYLWVSTGDPLFFINSQPAFGANRSSTIILLPQVLYRYLRIFITAAHDFRYWVSLFEFCVFALMGSVLVLDLIRLWRTNLNKHLSTDLGLNLFSLAVLIFPTLTGTLSSVPRYSLMSISFFIILSKIPNPLVKTFIALIFLIAHVYMLAFFIQGYFVS